jgi:hypothetical protein
MLRLLVLIFPLVKLNGGPGQQTLGKDLFFGGGSASIMKVAFWIIRLG